jgi:hypothetical protein
MSDAYYQERARRRTRRLVVAVILVSLSGCLVAGVLALFYDACTRSFDRSPQAVVQAYAEAVRNGNARQAQECWEHEAYYDLEAGCSEICLSRFYGATFEVRDVAVSAPYTIPGGRVNIGASITIACTGDGEVHTAEILLDSVATEFPWRHWSIVRSGLGGTAVSAWCQ